jgi:ribonuclease VapC
MDIVLETSALVAIGRKEHDAAVHLQMISLVRGGVFLPASCYLEAVMVLLPGGTPREWINDFLADNAITIAPITDTTARLAADAFERFGRGTGHPARLNFGDCLSYAIAMERDAPLLFKGTDFAHTDVKRVL